MKMLFENATCFWRSRLLVVEPHSKSIVPFCSSEMRFCEVIGVSLTCSFCTPSFFSTPATIMLEISCE